MTNIQDRYAEGVERGRREGLIVGEAKTDGFSHVDQLNESMTRRQSPVALKLLELQAADGREVSVLELGAGAGVACNDTAALLRKLGVPFTIHTVGRTPVDPYTRIGRTSRQIVKDLRGLLGPEAPLRDGTRDAIAKLKLHSNIGVELLDAVEAETGREVLERTEEPDIQLQMIGDWKPSRQWPRRYSLVTEQIGPLFYNDYSWGLLRSAYNAVEEGGVLRIDPFNAKSEDGRAAIHYLRTMVMKPGDTLKKYRHRGAETGLLLGRGEAGSETLRRLEESGMERLQIRDVA